MAIRDLFFNIFARDKTGAAFDNVAKKLRSIDGAAATVEQRLRRAGQGMARFGAMATAATAPVLIAFRDSLALYDVQARAEAKVAQAITSTGGAAGFTADELFRVASGLQEMTRFGDEEILASVTGQLLTFTNIAGDEFRRAQVAALDLSTVLENDVKSSAIMLGKALNDPVKGLSALGKAGIQFSAEQKAVIQSLAETGRVAEAQQLILSELERQYGGQAEASARTGLGALAQLSNAWGDVKEEVGRIVGDLLPPIVSALQGLVSAFQGLPEPVKRFVVLGGALAVAVGPLVAVLGLLTMGIAAIGAPVGLAIAGMVALGAAAVAFSGELRAAGEWVVSMVGTVEEWITVRLGAVYDWWSDKATRVGRDFANLYDAAVEGVSAMVTAIEEWFRGRLAAAFSFVTDKVAAVKGAFADLYDAVVGNSFVPDMVEEIGEWFGRLDSNMVGAAGSAADEVASVFDDLKSTVGNIFGDMVREGDFTLRRLASGIGSFASQLAGRAIDRGLGMVLDLGMNALGTGISHAMGWSMASPMPTPRPVRAATGADFLVGGVGGVDANRVTMDLTRGERVRVSRPGEHAAGGGGRPVYVTIQTPDPRSFAASRAQVSRSIAGAVARAERVA